MLILIFAYELGIDVIPFYTTVLLTELQTEKAATWCTAIAELLLNGAKTLRGGVVPIHPR